MRKTQLIFWGLIFLSIFSSCERSEGEGGKAVIEGKIFKIVDDGKMVYDNISGEYVFERDTIDAAEEDVYIIYGQDNSEFYGDRVRTSPDGIYKFRYLVSGNYSVYAYNNYPDKVKTSVIRSIKIGKDGTHRVPDIYIHDGKNAGLTGCVGQVMATYDGGGIPKPRMDIRVYLREKDQIAPVEDVRTDEEGYFVFTKLQPKTVYDIWVESEPNSKNQFVPVTRRIETLEAGTIKEVTPELVINIR